MDPAADIPLELALECMFPLKATHATDITELSIIIVLDAVSSFRFSRKR